MANNHNGQSQDVLGSSSSSSLANRSTFSLALDKFRRKSSISDIFSPTESTRKRSRIPTPHGIPRTTSFFTSLSTFSLNNSTTNGSAPSRASKLTSRLAQRPFWTRTDTVSAPVTPGEPTTDAKRRESSIQIPQHKLMAPLGPPMPRSKTFSVLASDTPQTPSPKTPHFARPTSSSEAKRRERVTSSEKKRLDISTPNLMASKVKHKNQGGTNLTINETPTTTRRSGSLLPTYTPRASSIAPRDQAQARRVEAPNSSDNGNRITSYNSISSPLSICSEVTTKLSNTHKVEPGLNRTQTSTTTRDGPSSSPFVSEPASEVASNCSSELDPELAFLSTPTPETNVRQISTAMPDIFWLGRVSALSDRFRTEELVNPPPRITPSPTLSGGAKTSKSAFNRGMHNTDRRTRRVFIHLNSLCTTDEARSSLAKFKERYEERMHLEDQWERGVKVMPTKKDNGKSKETRKSVEVREGEVERKLNVFERLMAKKRSRKSSLFQTSGDGPSNA